MATIKDWNGIEHHVHWRRVPGYYNRSTYHVDIDHEHVMTVRRTTDATWNRSAVWSAYRPGVDWSLSTSDPIGVEQRVSLRLAVDRTRELAVKAAWRRIQKAQAVA